MSLSIQHFNSKYTSYACNFVHLLQVTISIKKLAFNIEFFFSIMNLKVDNFLSSFSYKYINIKKRNCLFAECANLTSRI